MKIVRPEDVQIAAPEVVVIQTKATSWRVSPRSEPFSRYLMERLGPTSVHNVAVCTKDDAVLPTLAT